MATIGLDKLFYAPITEDENEEETYGTPVQLAKAISVELSVELAEAVLYADDGIAQIIKEFNSGTLTLGVDDIGLSAASELTGAEIDSNGVLVSTSEDDGKPVAVGFRAKKANGKYRYFWLYRVKFAVPATNLETKGESINFQTPSIEGTVMRRNKVYSIEDRSQVITIGGVEHKLILTTKATKDITKRYGGLEKLGDKLLKNATMEESLGEVIWLIALLANQEILIHNLQHRDEPKPLLTEDEIELLTNPYELAEYKDAIMAAMLKGTKRHVESMPEKNEKGNVQTGQSHQK